MSAAFSFYRYDGIEPVKITKTEAREWVRRVREDLRGFEEALASHDLAGLKDYADDAAGAAAELQSIAEATIEKQEG